MVLPCLMTAFNSIVASCLGWAGGRIKTEATLLFSYADNIVNLRKQVQDLRDAVKDLENRIQEAANRGETNTTAVVSTLLDRMTSLVEESSKIIRNEERSSDSTCLMGLRINLWACHSTSTFATKAIGEALELLEQVKTLDSVVANVDYSKFLGVTPIEDFEEFESRRQVSDQIVAALKDPNVNKVGIYGMGGTGKTALAEKIGAELHWNGTVNFVVLTTVSEKQNQYDKNYRPDLLNLQKKIAVGFKIVFKGETLNDRAVELREQLQKKDKILIILDDIWSGFELRNVGIPVGDVGNKIKILMTSRNEAVLLKEMNSKINFELHSLPNDDARTLFDRMVGGNIKYSNWHSTAKEVMIQCGGVPIILVTIAKSLRNEARESWEHALTQLKKFKSESPEKGVDEAYKMIEVSYKFLKTEELQKLLLFCAQLNHRSIPIEGLLRYAMGLNLFKDCPKLKDVRNTLHRCLSDLKACCLLQDGDEHGVIKMHDVIYKFASSMSFNNHNVFSVANDDELEDWPSKEQFEKFTAVSLPYCHLPPDQMLPAAFDNPKLESFLMLRSKMDAYFQIEDNFFKGMKGLKLMHLTLMSLSPALVSSLGALGELRTLWLDGCELSDISVIGELPMLQVLSLVGSSIVLVPKELGKLGNSLKLLDLRDCEKLKRIAAGVICKLTLLEDLRIGRSCNRWKLLEGNNHKRSNIVDETNEAEMASMEEFKKLQNLINLEIHILERTKMFPNDLVFKKLQAFKICFGSYDEWLHKEMSRSDYLSTRTLEVNESTAVEFDGEGSKALLTSVETLFLTGVMCSVTVSEMDRKGFPQLKHLTVKSAKGIQYIVKKNYNNLEGIFPKLESLSLYRLFKLERICNDHDHPLPVGSFENLRVIHVYKCDLLNHLLSSNLARGLLHIEEMRVEECESMERIIVLQGENEEEIQTGFAPQLRVLKLEELPCLMSFCSFKQVDGVPSPPTPLFNKKIIFSKLEELLLIDLKIEKIWDVDHLAIATKEIYWFQNLTSLKVYNCHNLTYLFTSSMVGSLAKLKQLEMFGGKSIEEIVSTRKGENEGDIQLSFPNLDILLLQYLPNIKRFCHANLLECQSLRVLFIKDCPELKKFVSVDESSSSDNSTTLFTEKNMFPQLEVLQLDDNLAVSTTEGVCWFQNLTKLEVDGCHNLSYLFTPSMVKSLKQLKHLEVSSCDSIEEIVSSKERPTGEDVQLLFPELDILQLKYLPNLKKFCEANLLECQSLRKLAIWECPELKTFVSANDSSSSDNSTTLFTEKVAFPNIEELEISGMGNLKMICGNELNPNSFSRLKILRIACLRDMLNVFSPSMSRRFLDLEELEITGCDSVEKVFDVQILSMNERETCRNLRSVVVLGCQSLTSIFTIYLVPSTLQQRERFEVRNCDKLDCNFEFPSLNRVIVENCPKMKCFSNGDLSTPKLIRVWPSWVDEEDEEKQQYEAKWEGDLNSTIRQMFEEKVTTMVDDDDDDDDEEDNL